MIVLSDDEIRKLQAIAASQQCHLRKALTIAIDYATQDVAADIEERVAARNAERTAAWERKRRQARPGGSKPRRGKSMIAGPTDTVPIKRGKSMMPDAQVSPELPEGAEEQPPPEAAPKSSKRSRKAKE